MKFTAFFAAFAFSTIAPLLAITDADIAPEALAGKTLVFEIVNGGAPYATTGSFSCTFEALGNGFNLENLDGDTVPASTTYTASTSGGFTECQIPGFIAGQGDATLTLYVADGVGNYEIFIDGVNGVSLNGTFDINLIEVRVVKTPEIDVKQGKSVLKDGMGKVDFSTVLVTKRGKSRTKAFTITNSGNAPLKKLGFSVTGKNRKEFQVSAPKIGTIPAGGSVTIRVTFTPQVIGMRKASLHILSNDKDEASFDVRLSGAGGGKK
jgi:hypothetical protein